MDRYKRKGICIWCGKTEPETSFECKPHIMPDSLGGEELGVDICDECNHFFGTAPKGKLHIPSIDHAFKEVFGAFRMFSRNLNSQSYKSFSSTYFSYFHNKGKGVIRVNKNFNSIAVTRQFKRGLYEVFLQKYHYETGDGNNPIFEAVRDYARYDKGNLKVYYAFNNIILAPKDEEFNHPFIHMSKPLIKDIKQYGFFNLWLMGHHFYLEVIPTLANINRELYLSNQANHCLINAVGNERIFEFSNIEQIDFLMNRFQN